MEPELHLGRDILVPDFAGWRRERLPRLPETPYFELAPDWVCEILSPSTESKDRQVKMPIYAHYGVRYVWLVDPRNRTLEAFKVVDGEWSETGRFSDRDTVVAEPFDAIAIDLSGLWP